MFTSSHLWCTDNIRQGAVGFYCCMAHHHVRQKCLHVLNFSIFIDMARDRCCFTCSFVTCPFKLAGNVLFKTNPNVSIGVSHSFLTYCTAFVMSGVLGTMLNAHIPSMIRTDRTRLSGTSVVISSGRGHFRTEESCALSESIILDPSEWILEGGATTN